MNEIKVTVLMPAYNCERYIGEAVQSVLSQTFPHFELLIVNDGSTDKTVQIVESFNDPRIVLVSQLNGGVSKALNTGLKSARAEFIARFDADDICHPERLQVQYDFMNANPEYLLTGSNAEYIDMNGEHIFSFNCAAFTDRAIRALDTGICPFLHVAVMYRKKEVLEAGGYNEYAHTFEDHFLWANLITKGKVCNLPQALVAVRINPESLTIDEKWRGARFRKLKYAAIRNGSISAHDSREVQDIVKSQNVPEIKKGAYHALLAKKYLWNNYNPVKARINIRRLINIHPFKLEAYIMLSLSFLPQRIIAILYKTNKRRSNDESIINFQA